MTRPIRPRLLLRHAQQLADHQSGEGRPLATWLRRATSAAYYAVFHAVATAVAAQLSPSSAQADQHRLARSIGHERLSEASGWLLKPKAGREQVRPIVARLQGNADLVALAGILVRLQQARHEADYDHLAVIRKAATVAHIREAGRALTIVDRVRDTPEGEEFFALVALHSALR